MTQIRIYDGNNFVRLALEADFTGRGARTIYEQIEATSGVVLFVWDGEGGNRKRREFYPEYKRNRKPLKQDIYVGFDMVEDVLKFSKAIQIKVPGYEADDVIATLARTYAQANDQVSIYSNDADMLQLSAEFPNHIFTGARIKDGVPPHLIKYYKVTVGDPADNIPGIAGFGLKAWEDVDKNRLADFIDEIVAGVEPTTKLDLPPRCKVDFEQIRTFWKIVSFIPVPFELMSKHMTVGTPNPAAADSLLKEFFL